MRFHFSMTGEQANPAEVIPPRYRDKPPPPRKKTAAEIEREDRGAWMLLDSFFNPNGL